MMMRMDVHLHITFEKTCVEWGREKWKKLLCSAREMGKYYYISESINT